MDCSPKSLQSLVSDGDVEFDADIAGPGVLAAFLITSLIALTTLILAFLTISVPARLLNSGVAVIATGVRRTYHRLRAKFPKTKRTKVVHSRAERTHAFMSFMIAISDQILVSRASVLIAALIIHDDITIYSANIVITLGCLASTVHLGSFPFYIDRIKDHSSAKLIRVLAMVTGSGMLVFLLVIQLSYTWDMESHVYFICTLQDYQMNDEMGGEDYISIFIGMFVPLTPGDEKPNGSGTQSESIVPRQNRSNLNAQQLQDNGGIELQMLRTLEHQASTENYVDPSGIAIESNVYGIITIFTSRAVTTGMSGNPNEMGFGQVVPLTLLALPIFAAMEGHADYKQKLKSIEKAHVDQANLEVPVTGSMRSQLRGQSTQRQNMPEEINIASIKTVQDVLKKRAKDIGYPELYNWVTGDDLTSASSLQMGVAVHAAVMFAITTLLSFSMACDIANINITLIVFLFVFAARRLIGLCLVGLDMRSYPMILDHLGCTGHLLDQQSGSQDESMVAEQAAGDTGEDLGNQGRQEEA
ncbi:hypothetical protein F25303_5366 [Fusarium sp. NRRL 25303]|nr:hypothetical protein F25303_5366 [Fusarium sp. NRRL 25303]